MLAQLIVGPAEEEKETDRAIRESLEQAGYNVRLVGVDEAVQRRYREQIAIQLSQHADLTVANSGIRWENVTRLVPPELLPNGIVITSSASMQYAWDYKPVIIIDRTGSLEETLRQAVLSLKDSPPRLPVHSGTFIETPYGLRLSEEDAGDEVDIWRRFMGYVKPGFRISTRSQPDGSAKQFTITKMLDAMFVLKVDGTDQVVAVTREELQEHYTAWAEEKRGEQPGAILINDYVMGILDWMDNARLLN